MVDGLKNQLVYLVCAIGLKGKTHNLESVCEALNTNTDRSVTHVRSLSLHDWIEVAVNHLVEVLRDALGDPVEGLVVELLRLGAGKLRQGDGGQIAHSDLILVRVLEDLRAEV